MAYFGPSLGSIFDFGEEGVGGGGFASRLVLERETHNLGQNRQKPLTTPYLKIKDRKTACFDLPIAPSPEGDKIKEADSLVFHFIISKIMELCELANSSFFSSVCTPLILLAGRIQLERSLRLLDQSKNNKIK